VPLVYSLLFIYYVNTQVVVVPVPLKGFAAPVLSLPANQDQDELPPEFAP
jgi:hypothetical protein